MRKRLPRARTLRADRFGCASWSDIPDLGRPCVTADLWSGGEIGSARLVPGLGKHIVHPRGEFREGHLVWQDRRMLRDCTRGGQRPQRRRAAGILSVALCLVKRLAFHHVRQAAADLQDRRATPAKRPRPERTALPLQRQPKNRRRRRWTPGASAAHGHRAACWCVRSAPPRPLREGTACTSAPSVGRLIRDCAGLRLWLADGQADRREIGGPCGEPSASGRTSLSEHATVARAMPSRGR